MAEDFMLSVGLVADTDQLEQQIEDGDYTQTVDFDGGGGAGGRGGRNGLLTGILGGEAIAHHGAGGGGGGLLGGISKMVLLLGAAVGFLAMLEPIQKMFSAIQRIFSLLLAPVLVALRPVLTALLKATLTILDLFGVIDTSRTATIQEINTANRAVGGPQIPENNPLSGVDTSGLPGNQDTGRSPPPSDTLWWLDLAPEAQTNNSNNNNRKGRRETFGGGSGGGGWQSFLGLG